MVRRCRAIVDARIIAILGTSRGYSIALILSIVCADLAMFIVPMIILVVRFHFMLLTSFRVSLVFILSILRVHNVFMIADVVVFLFIRFMLFIRRVFVFCLDGTFWKRKRVKQFLIDLDPQFYRQSQKRRCRIVAGGRCVGDGCT